MYVHLGTLRFKAAADIKEHKLVIEYAGEVISLEVGVYQKQLNELNACHSSQDYF